MFRGQFVHAIDVKGRVSVPARFRDVLAEKGDARCVLSPAPFDPCLHLFSLREWEQLEAKIAELPQLDRHVQRLRRIYVSAAVDCEVDKAGRVLIPPHLRDQAGLEKDVFFAGMGRNAELWAKERWDRALELSAEDEAAFRQAVMEQLKL